MGIENRRIIWSIIVVILITGPIAKDILMTAKGYSLLLWAFFLILFPLIAIIDYYNLTQRTVEELSYLIN